MTLMVTGANTFKVCRFRIFVHGLFASILLKIELVLVLFFFLLIGTYRAGRPYQTACV